jgi:ubiquinone/menaquinone biosynthesis C-methylase UbiE
MPHRFDPGKDDELPSTYFVPDRRNKDEMARLTIQDTMLTTSMGGVLPEQTDPTIFHRVLDVACGTGGWAIEVARTYPTISLVGIDISERMIEYAGERASEAQVADRVSFQITDAIRQLEFPPASFDLVNQRLALSFVRTWEWPQLVSDFQRILRKGGILRLTEADTIEQSSSPVLLRLHRLLLQALYNAGNFFAPQTDGLTNHLAPLLRRHGLEDVQMREHLLTYHGNTLAGQHFAKDTQYFYRTIYPFLQKWTRVPDDYETLYRQAVDEIQQKDCVTTWRFVTIWGRV